MVARTLHRLPPALAACCLAALLLAVTGADMMLPAWVVPAYRTFLGRFAGIVLDSFPFLLLGVSLSALVQEFVPDAAVRRLAPRRTAPGIVFGGLLGLALPLCECGLVPLVRRLIGKGMPAYIGFVYLAAGPVINPAALLSTWAAFPDRPSLMLFARAGLAFAIAAAIGMLMRRRLETDPPLKAFPAGEACHPHGCSCAAHTHAHAPTHMQVPARDGSGGSDGGRTGRRRAPFARRLGSAAVHAFHEFADTGRYILAGAFLAALAQSLLPASALTGFSSHPAAAYAAAMGGAFLLSLCSSSDAFVAAVFAGAIGTGPVLAFLVFGPAVDLKSTMMLLAVFRRSVVVRFVLLAALAAGFGSAALVRLTGL